MRALTKSYFALIRDGVAQSSHPAFTPAYVGTGPGLKIKELRPTERVDTLTAIYVMYSEG